MSQKSNIFKKFSLIATFSVVLTIFLGYHASDILFGDNSLKVYNSLKIKEEYLRSEIKRLQMDNAYLQKEYFELKILEPENE